MRKLFVMFGIVLLSACMVLIACSDNATDSELTEGDPQDPGFQTARLTANGVVDSLFMTAETASDFITFDGSQPMSVASDSFAIFFDDATCWWHLYLGADTTNSSLLFVDSLKFQDALGCQQYPDSLTTTEIDYRAVLDVSVVADSGSFIANAHDNVVLQGIQEDTCVINADVSRNIDLQLSLFTVEYSYDGSLTDIKFLTQDLRHGTNPHPLSGELSLTMTISGSSPDGTGSGTWSITITFNPDGYHARAERGLNYWEWDVVYVV